LANGWSFGQRGGKIKLSLANESWTFRSSSTTMTVFPPSEPVRGIFRPGNFMIKKPEAIAPAIAPAASQHAASNETDQQRFERILSRDQFKSLKAVLDNLGMAVPALQAAIITTNSYQMFLAKLGYRVIVVKQIHEQDCYARLGPKGGIRAVLPVHDMATYSTLVTLVNFDSTLTTTPKSVDYYDNQLAEFKTNLMNRSGNAA